jgi:hypothetical protein
MRRRTTQVASIPPTVSLAQNLKNPSRDPKSDGARLANVPGVE